MRLTLKVINNELAKRGYTVRLAKSTGYFYFQFGEAASWLDRTVNVATINSLTLPEWIAEFELLRKFNGQDLRSTRNNQHNVGQHDTLTIPYPRAADSGRTSSPSLTPAMPTGEIPGKTKAPRRKPTKSSR
jgi:hypothetical protein